VNTPTQTRQPPAAAGSSPRHARDGDGPGQTSVADRVVEKVAAQAVAEVDNATGTPRQLLGVTLGATTEETPARVDASVDGGLVTVRVQMAVAWPASVRHVTRQVREHVTRQVEELTNLRVAEVDIEVAHLLTETRQPARVE
jgi:uncharacterized alkaline shock family protein YloU